MKGAMSARKALHGSEKETKNWVTVARPEVGECWVSLDSVLLTERLGLGAVHFGDGGFAVSSHLGGKLVPGGCKFLLIRQEKGSIHHIDPI